MPSLLILVTRVHGYIIGGCLEEVSVHVCVFETSSWPNKFVQETCYSIITQMCLTCGENILQLPSLLLGSCFSYIFGKVLTAIYMDILIDVLTFASGFFLARL